MLMMNYCWLMQGALASAPPPFLPHQAGGNVPLGQTRTKVCVREDKLEFKNTAPESWAVPEEGDGWSEESLHRCAEGLS